MKGDTMARYLFTLSLLMQFTGFVLVSKCLFNGLQMGDYGHQELYEFVGGSALFYLGNVLKKKA